MMKRIPIKAAKDVAKKYGMSRVVLVFFESDENQQLGPQHVVTWGRTYRDCVEAARLGNRFKRVLGWPEHLCQTKPARQIRNEKDGEK